MLPRALLANRRMRDLSHVGLSLYHSTIDRSPSVRWLLACGERGMKVEGLERGGLAKLVFSPKVCHAGSRARASLSIIALLSSAYVVLESLAESNNRLGACSCP